MKTPVPVRTITECDYVVYLDDELDIMGYELTIEEQEHLTLLYDGLPVDLHPPPSTEFVVEAIGIETTLVWAVEEDEKGKQQSQVLYYRPSMISLAKEVIRTRSSEGAPKIEEYLMSNLTTEADLDIKETEEKISEMEQSNEQG